MEYALAHPFFTFILALVLVLLVFQLLMTPFRVVNRWLRHKNIVARGWPPEHLDADGDVVKKGKLHVE